MEDNNNPAEALEDLILKKLETIGITMELKDIPSPDSDGNEVEDIILTTPDGFHYAITKQLEDDYLNLDDLNDFLEIYKLWKHGL